jgi:autotransporter-associated beta strand protein
MILRFLYVFLGCSLSILASAQTLTISSAANSGTYNYSAGTLTVSGAANIQATEIQTWLGSGNLSIVGSTSALTVNVSQAITYTTSGSSLTIGATNNTGTVILNNSLSLAGSLSINASRVSVLGTLNLTGSSSNLSITSTNTVVNATSTIGGSASITSTGNFILGTNITTGTGYPFTATGGFTKSGAGTSYLFSDIITSNSAVSLTGPVVLGNFNSTSTTTEIKSNGGNINIPGAVSAYTGTGRDYLMLLYTNIYAADGGIVSGSTTDIYLRFNAGAHSFAGLPGMSSSFNMQYLVVAGGGGGGNAWFGYYTGGAGGGGGVADGTYSYDGTPLSIMVGVGGAQNTSGTDSYLATIKSGGGGAGGNYGTGGSTGSAGITGNGGASYAAGGGGGGHGSNVSSSTVSGGYGTQRIGGSGVASYSEINCGGAGGGATGNGSGYNNGGAGYASSITGVSLTYGSGGSIYTTVAAKTGQGGGSLGYGTPPGSDGIVIIRFTLPNAANLNAQLPYKIVHLNAGAGGITLGSTVADLSSLTITSDGTTSIAGLITGSGSLTKAGASTLTLSGNNTYAGGTIVNGGILKLNDIYGNGYSVIRGELTVNQYGTVQLSGSVGSLGWHLTQRVTKININNGGLIEAISGQQHIWNLDGGLNFNGGGTLRSNGGTSDAAATSYIEWGVANVTITNPTAPAEIAGRIRLRSDFTGGAITFAVNDGTTEHDLLISAAITQWSAPTVTKTGTGKMTFTGANNYTGTTTISTGVFQVGDGSTTGSISDGSVVNNASVIFKRSNDYTISNAISGTGTVQKLGAGTLTFSGGNSYTGVTTVTQGVLKLGATNALGTIAGNTVVSDGAAIDLNGMTLSPAEPLTINGTGLSSNGVLYNSSTTAVTLPSPITLGAAALIKGGSANLTISGAINGAFNLEVQGTNNSFTQSGIIGATSAPTSYTINTGTGSVTLGAAATIAGPVNMHGNNITLNSTLTASGSNVSLNANTAVTQTQPIISSGLSLNGTGTFTLTNTSNNFTILAGGSSGSLLGATQIVDVSGGLTIGTVGSTTGLTGSSTIRVETLADNLTLAGNISTTSTSTDALILTAAKSTAIGDPTGGDIIVSGSPTITLGSGAIAKLFSGYDVTSTGLTTLVGGAANARYTYDETSTTFNPTLSTNNKYAIYRTGLGYGDLNIVSSGGDAEGTTWTYTNGVIQTISGTANVSNTDIQTKLNSANLSIEANKVTFSANITGTTSNSFSILSKTHIINTNATTISTNGGNVLLASNVDDVSDGESITNGYIHFSSGLTITTSGGNITLGGGDATASGYALGSSTSQFCGIRVHAIINLNSGAGNIVMRGKSYAIGTTSEAWGVGFWNLTTGSITSGTGTITLDGFSQSFTGTYSSGLFSNGALTLTSANTTADAIKLIGKGTGTSGEAWALEAESALSLIATGEGGGVTISSSQQQAGSNLEIVLRGETNILAKSGPINLLGGQSGGLANGALWLNNNVFLGSKASSAVTSSSSNITIQYDLYSFNNYNPKLATSGTLNWKPNSTSFGQDVATSWFSWNQNSQTLSGLTIGKTGNTTVVYPNTAITVAGPVNLYGNTIGFLAELTASGDLSLYANTAVTQSAAIIAAGLSLNGTGTFTLNNASNNFTTLAGGAAGSLLGAIDIVDVSGGLTIGTVGSNTGLTGSGTMRVETLAGNISLAESISTTNTTSDAVILNAAKSTAIGVGTGGDIIVSGTPTITTGSGGIVKLFSGLEATSTGLTSLAGGSSNVRNNYDETTTTFSPVLSSNNKYAIYRTSSGVGALTIVSTGGDAINTTWTYSNGVINTITTPVNILSSVIENYLASGPLTINAGNTTVNASITSTSSNALVFNANSTLSNTTPITTVNAAITNGGSITINTGTFNINHNISTTSTAVITISANNGFSTTTATSTRYTISTVGGNITINADNDANGTGLVDIDDLTLNPGTANLIIRGETFNFNTTQTRKPYINGTGSFTFESNDVAFGQDIITNWFVIDQDANGMSGLTLGKSGSTANVTLNTACTVAGPISIYGGVLSLSSAITSSATGDILLKGTTNTGLCISVTGAITKTAGTGTLTMQGHGRVDVAAAVAATGSASLNVIMWSDFDGDNVGGGSTLSSGGSISTNGGHVWMGGSNSSGGSYTWNGLAVGDGPSIGASGANCYALDLFGPITTANGDVLLWASSSGCGNSGIVSEVSVTSRHINAGSGNITFISPQTTGAIELTSTGVISLIPHAGSYAGALTIGGTLTTGNFSFNTSYYNGLKINSLATTGLVIGNYSGHLSGATAVNQGNTSNVTVSSALSTKSLELYGGALTLSAALSTNNTTSGNMSLNGTTLSGGSLAVADGRTLTMNLSSNTTYTGAITGNNLSFVKNGAGTLALTGATAWSFVDFTISAGAYRLNPNQQLTLSNALTNNGTFRMKDGATFVQGTSVTSITGAGTFIVEKALAGNTSSWSNTSGRFWYMGVPMANVARSSYGNYVSGSNHVWSYSEANKQYTDIISNAATLSAGTGYVHRRTANDTLTFSAVGVNGLYGGDLSLTNLTRTTGTSAGYHLISNPYMAFLDWHTVTKTNIEPTYYIRTNNSTGGNISALISYNANLPNLYTNTSNLNLTAAQLQYIAPMQSIWVRVGTAAATGSLGMTRSMLSHPNNNVGLKSSTVFPNLARVNLVDGNNFDQLLVYLNGDMSNEVDEYDSEKMPVGGTVQVYTMSSNKKLVMNGLKNNKKKVSVPLYLELPQTKSYTLQLSEYQVEDGLILLEDKQEGTIQDFTLMENYTFYANSGLLQNRFVLHFILPNAELATQGPSNSWVAAEEGSYTEGGDVEISNDDRGNIEITLNQAAEQKVEGTVFVTDMNGKEVYNGKLEGITTAIELDVPSGIYYLTVQSGTLIEKKKVYIQE